MRDYSNLYIPVSIIVAGAIIGLAVYATLGKSGGNTAGAPTQQEVNIKDVKLAGEPYIGKENAKLTMAYWSDYQCPFCKQFELNVLPSLIKKYVDTGKLKIVFKDFAFLGEDSNTAAEYEKAVWELFPTKFFAWREAMYKAQDEEGDQGFGDAASIDKLTATIGGIDVAAVKARVASSKSKYDTSIAADQTEGASFGIQGTPGFIIGNKGIDGAQPLGAFQAAIDPQLK
jgi:protein-disulfide isomerase